MWVQKAQRQADTHTNLFWPVGVTGWTSSSAALSVAVLSLLPICTLQTMLSTHGFDSWRPAFLSIQLSVCSVISRINLICGCLPAPGLFLSASNSNTITDPAAVCTPPDRAAAVGTADGRRCMNSGRPICRPSSPTCPFVRASCWLWFPFAPHDTGHKKAATWELLFCCFSPK